MKWNLYQLIYVFFSKKKSEIQSNKATLRVAWDIYDPIKYYERKKTKIKIERPLKMKL